jgi:hypothetical protein
VHQAPQQHAKASDLSDEVVLAERQHGEPG